MAFAYPPATPAPIVPTPAPAPAAPVVPATPAAPAPVAVDGFCVDCALDANPGYAMMTPEQKAKAVRDELGQVATTTVISGDTPMFTTKIRLMFGVVGAGAIALIIMRGTSAILPAVLLAVVDVIAVLVFELRLEEMHSNEWAVIENNGHATKWVVRHGRVWREFFQKLVRFTATDSNVSLESTPRTSDGVSFKQKMTFPAELSEHVAEQKGSTRWQSRAYHTSHAAGGQAVADKKLMDTAKARSHETWSGVKEDEVSNLAGLVAEITEAKMRLRHWTKLLPHGMDPNDHVAVIAHFRHQAERERLAFALKSEPLSSHFADAEIDAGKVIGPGLAISVELPENVNKAREVVVKAKADAGATKIAAKARATAYATGAAAAKKAGVSEKEIGVHALIIADLASDGLAIAGKNKDDEGLLVEKELTGKKNKGGK